ncbi:C-type lectin BpLec-like [Chrysemys picta bellii]|uniref:C-type lectin BpLec-like n=1 Tax=Chrysemys picta bellii TaxID=8478 RepID=UPI0032B2603D
MGPVAYFSLCLLGCLIFNPALEAAPHTVLSPRLGRGIRTTSCRRGWLHYNYQCYRFFPEKKTWSEAEVQCQHHRRGSHLASILTEAEGNMVANYITRSGSKDYVWIGLHDPEKDRTWTWTDGSLYRYKAWIAGEPRDLNNEYCTELLKYRGFKEWNNVSCASKNAFICKYEL